TGGNQVVRTHPWEVLVWPSGLSQRQPGATGIRLGTRHSRNETLWKVSLRVRSVRLDAGELDHLAPLLRFVGYELSKVGGRAWEHEAAKFVESACHLNIHQSPVTIGEGLLEGRRWAMQIAGTNRP